MVLFRACACNGAPAAGLPASALPRRGCAGVLRASAARAPMGQRDEFCAATVPCGFCCEVAQRKSRPGSLADRVRRRPSNPTGLNRRQARAKHRCCSPTLFQVAVAPGGHTARASSRRCPPLDARATAPSGVLFSSLPAALKAAPRHHGRGAPLPLGRDPPLPIDELGHHNNHLDNHSAVAVGARRAPRQSKDHPGDGA